MYWVTYKNGNYTVLLNTSNGTKIRYNNLDNFDPDRVESMDVKISNRCNHGCAFCHENSHGYGTIAAIQDVAEFASTLPPYTEIALGGGNLLEPEDITFTEACLKVFREAKAICSITVHQQDFINNFNYIQYLINKGLVHGVGVSLHNCYDKKLWQYLDQMPNAVLHVIAGLLNSFDIGSIITHKPKILILGYKKVRRGYNYYNQTNNYIEWGLSLLKEKLPNLMANTEVCSFDNLAIEQLDLQNLLSEKEWEKYYMGDDGTTTFYVDLVDMQYAESSTSNIRYVIQDNNANIMFNHIRKEKNNE